MTWQDVTQYFLELSAEKRHAQPAREMFKLAVFLRQQEALQDMTLETEYLRLRLFSPNSTLFCVSINNESPGFFTLLLESPENQRQVHHHVPTEFIPALLAYQLRGGEATGSV